MDNDKVIVEKLSTCFTNIVENDEISINKV